MRIGIIIGLGIGTYLVYRAYLDKLARGPEIVRIPGMYEADVYPPSTMLDGVEPWELNAQEGFRGF